MTEQKQIAEKRMVRPTAPRPTAGAAQLTPKDIIAILRRHIWLIIIMTIIGIMCGGAGWFLMMRYFPKYTARGGIRVLPTAEKDPMKIGGPIGNKDIQYGARVALAARIKDQSTLQQLIDRDKVQDTDWFHGFGDLKDKRIRKSVKELKKKFGVSPQRDGDAIVLTMTCAKPEEAALIVNEMMDLFVASQGSTKQRDVASRLTGLERQRLRVSRDFDVAEKSLDEVRKRYGFSDLEERTYEDTFAKRLAELEKEEDLLFVQIRETSSNIKRLEERAVGPINEQVENQIERDPVMLSLMQQIVGIEAQLAGVMTKFGENHRIVRQTRQRLEKTREKRLIRKREIAEQTRQAQLKDAQDVFLILEDTLEELKGRREEARERKRDLDIARVQFAKRAVIRDERKEQLNLIKSQIEKLKIIHDDPETPKVQKLGSAPVPLEVSSPNWKVYFPGGTMLGFMLGVGLAFLIELANDLVRTPRDVGRYLHIPLLGVIPHADEDELLDEDIELCHIVRLAPYSIISECYRRFRTNLKLSKSAQSSKVILITSGVARDGKTSVASNLATAFVAEDKKVLLVDANFWQPNLHKIFSNGQQHEQDAPEGQTQQNEPAGFGLSTLLANECDYHQAIKSVDIENLHIIESGPRPHNPAELLGGVQMEKLINEQRQNYDYIIIDGPPVLLVSDTKMLAMHVDGTIVVFNANATRRGAALRTIRELRQVDANIAGCVLVALKALKGGYFNEQFKSYHEYQKLQLAHSL